MVGKQEIGEGAQRQEIITIRPLVPGLDATTHFFTQSGLVFDCRVRSFPQTSMVRVSWDVPQRQPIAHPRQVGTGSGSLFPQRQATDHPLVDVSRIHTAYEIKPVKGSPPWVPLTVYDDGTRTFIQF